MNLNKIKLKIKCYIYENQLKKNEKKSIVKCFSEINTTVLRGKTLVYLKNYLKITSIQYNYCIYSTSNKH